MKHIKDIIYKGHEIVIGQDEDGYIADVREDDFDGALIAGYCEINTAEEAEDTAKAFVDELLKKEAVK